MHQCADKGRGIDIAGAVTALCDFAVLIISRFLALQHHDACGFRLVADPGQNDGFCARVTELLQQLADPGFVIAVAILGVGQEAGFGDVRQDDVGGEGKGFHGLHIFMVKGGIKLPVIRHGGIYNAGAAGSGERCNDVFDVVDLAGAAEITRINTVKQNAFLFPVFGDGRDVVGQVTDRKTGKAGRMGGEHGRRENTGFKACRRQNRQGDRERTLPDTGNILNGKDFFVRHGKTSLRKPAAGC